MNFIDDISLQYYKGGVDSEESKSPAGTLKLRTFIEGIKKPKQKTIELFHEIKECAKKGDLVGKNNLKKNLIFVTPGANCNGISRGYDNIVEFNPLVQIDFDGIQNAEEFKQYFFNRYKSTVMMGVSPSGLGCKGLIRIPKVQTVDEYKAYYHGLAYYLEQYSGFDISPEKPTLPLFYFIDKNLLVRECPKESRVRGFKVNGYGRDYAKFESNTKVDAEIEKQVIGTIYHIFNTIVETGHPKVVSYATSIGGWVAGNWVTMDNAVAAMEDAISKNEYLSKNTKGYLRTANQMFNKGLGSPLIYKYYEK